MYKVHNQNYQGVLDFDAFLQENVRYLCMYVCVFVYRYAFACMYTVTCSTCMTSFTYTRTRRRILRFSQLLTP